ncbi:hypothetical protein ABEF95_007723 [Exophiala dermatitidis]
MLIKGIRRLAFFVGPLLLLIVVAVLLYGSGDNIPLLGDTSWTANKLTEGAPGTKSRSSLQDSFLLGNPSKSVGNNNQSTVSHTHTEIFSVSTKDGKYFPIKFGDEEAINPSIIPHPTRNDTWIIVAQQGKSPEDQSSLWFTELVCDAQFKKGRLECLKPPKILPMAATLSGDKCTGDLSYFALNVGPHDARVFYGPDAPYAIYGSNSALTCFGQWIQDFRMLVDWKGETVFAGNPYRLGTELQRPPPYGLVEKNWFVFWDTLGDAYVHYDVAPTRVFAKLEYDGSVGQDLAPLAAFNDEQCMSKYMPKVAEQLESIHQATNSLSITLCERSDPGCEPNDANTYILTIFQHKSFYSYHSVYEPYVMLFKRTAPFEVHAISSKPIWIHGRGKAGEAERPEGAEFQQLAEWNQTEMVYVTSISWKAHGQKYHGYRDDVLFLNFGIEDKRTGGIDIIAGDLLKDVNLCAF